MKKLLFTCLAIAIIFTACKKEEEITAPIPTSAFSCKIDGVDFFDNNPVATLSTDDIFELVASNGSDEVIIYIYNLSNKTEGEEISLVSPSNTTNRVYVNLGTASYTDTESGQLIFSNIGNPLSGTFNVICKAANFQSVTVTEGKFVDVAY